MVKASTTIATSPVCFMSALRRELFIKETDPRALISVFNCVSIWLFSSNRSPVDKWTRSALKKLSSNSAFDFMFNSVSVAESESDGLVMIFTSVPFARFS